MQTFFVLNDAYLYKKTFNENFSISRAIKNVIHKFWNNDFPKPMNESEFKKYFLQNFGMEITDDNISDILAKYPKWNEPNKRGSLINKLHADINLYSRDPHMIKCIFNAVNAHNCVLATFGAGHFDIKCVCHTSLKLRVALLCVNCSASACHPKRSRREGWLGRTRGNGGVPPFPFWEICDFLKWLQNINNVLRCKCETYLHNPCECQIKKYPCGGYFDIKCVCHTSLKLRVALLCVNCSASACHPKRSRREGWLGRTDSNHDKENQNLLSYH